MRIINKRPMLVPYGFLIKPLLNTAGVRGFLINNPFIYFDKGNFDGAIFTQADLPPAETDYIKIHKACNFSGISKLVTYRLVETGNVLWEEVKADVDNSVSDIP